MTTFPFSCASMEVAYHRAVRMGDPIAQLNEFMSVLDIPMTITAAWDQIPHAKLDLILADAFRCPDYHETENDPKGSPLEKLFNFLWAKMRNQTEESGTFKGELNKAMARGLKDAATAASAGVDEPPMPMFFLLRRDIERAYMQAADPVSATPEDRVRHFLTLLHFALPEGEPETLRDRIVCTLRAPQFEETWKMRKGAAFEALRDFFLANCLKATPTVECGIERTELKGGPEQDRLDRLMTKYRAVDRADLTALYYDLASRPERVPHDTLFKMSALLFSAGFREMTVDMSAPIDMNTGNKMIQDALGDPCFNRITNATPLRDSLYILFSYIYVQASKAQGDNAGSVPPQRPKTIEKVSAADPRATGYVNQDTKEFEPVPGGIATRYAPKDDLADLIDYVADHQTCPSCRAPVPYKISSVDGGPIKQDQKVPPSYRCGIEVRCMCGWLGEVHNLMPFLDAPKDKTTTPDILAAADVLCKRTQRVASLDRALSDRARSHLVAGITMARMVRDLREYFTDELGSVTDKERREYLLDTLLVIDAAQLSIANAKKG